MVSALLASPEVPPNGHPVFDALVNRQSQDSESAGRTSKAVDLYTTVRVHWRELYRYQPLIDFCIICWNAIIMSSVV